MFGGLRGVVGGDNLYSFEKLPCHNFSTGLYRYQILVNNLGQSLMCGAS